jgi:hypothetical protein
MYWTVSQLYQTVSHVRKGDWVSCNKVTHVRKGDWVSCTKQWVMYKRWLSQLYQTVTHVRKSDWVSCTKQWVMNEKVTESAAPNGDWVNVPNGDWISWTKRWLSCTKRWLKSTKRWQSRLYQTMTQKYQTVTESAVPNGDSYVPKRDWVRLAKDELDASNSDSNRKYVTAFTHNYFFLFLLFLIPSQKLCLFMNELSYFPLHLQYSTNFGAVLSVCSF